MKLRIGHLDYTVGAYPEGDPGYTENYGVTRLYHQQILIDANASAARQLDTLIHEITHAAWDAAGKLQEDTLTQEQTANFIGVMFAQIIRANKNLLPVLMAMREGAGFMEVGR